MARFGNEKGGELIARVDALISEMFAVEVAWSEHDPRRPAPIWRFLEIREVAPGVNRRYGDTSPWARVFSCRLALQSGVRLAARRSQDVASGAPGRTRTADAGLRTASLCPLSYGGADLHPTPRWEHDRPVRRHVAMAAAPPCGGLLLSGAQRGPSPTIPFEMAVTPLPDLVLYSRPGCGLCDETRDLLTALLAERASSDLAAPDPRRARHRVRSGARARLLRLDPRRRARRPATRARDQRGQAAPPARRRPRRVTR